MVSIKSLLTGALLAVAAVAQNPTTNFSSSDIQGLVSGSGGANSPTASQKVDWCKSQQALCGVLCNGGNKDNKCDDTSLSWSCTCSNGSTPGLQYYPYSIIGNECNALLGNCLAQNANVQSQQNACKSKYVCGNATALDANNSANAAASAAASGTMTASVTGSSATASATAHHNAAATAQMYGPGVVAVAVLGALGMAL